MKSDWGKICFTSTITNDEITAKQKMKKSYTQTVALIDDWKRRFHAVTTTIDKIAIGQTVALEPHIWLPY